jgi:hypothetical protein
MQTFRGCLPAVSFTIRGYMSEHIASKRRADTSRTFRQLLETLNVPVPEVILTPSCARSVVTGTLNSCQVAFSECGLQEVPLRHLSLRALITSWPD